MDFTFTVTVEVERQEGKFASRDEIATILAERLAEAEESIDGVGADCASTYEVVNFEVAEVPQPKRRRR